MLKNFYLPVNQYTKKVFSDKAKILLANYNAIYR